MNKTDTAQAIEIGRLECEMRELERLFASRMAKIHRRIEKIKKEMANKTI
jgi:hypothetical protein